MQPALMLLERERELELLEDRLAEARGRRGQAVLIEASPGLGKTSLLRATGEAAERAGFACLRARASELERDFAYGCVRQLLEPGVARASQTERAAMFEGAAALAKPLFAPVGEDLGPPSLDSAFGMLHGLYWLAANVAEERPLALVVDDLHWADAESLRFLNYLAPRLDGLALALVASVRAGAMSVAELPRLAAAPETTVLRPRPLSGDGTARLCELMFGAAVAPAFTPGGGCGRPAGGSVDPGAVQAAGLHPPGGAGGRLRRHGPAGPQVRPRARGRHPRRSGSFGGARGRADRRIGPRGRPGAGGASAPGRRGCAASRCARRGARVAPARAGGASPAGRPGGAPARPRLRRAASGQPRGGGSSRGGGGALPGTRLCWRARRGSSRWHSACRGARTGPWSSCCR